MTFCNASRTPPRRWPRCCCVLEATVELLLRKYLWALDGVVVCLCAGILGHAASGLVESRYVGATRRHRTPASFRAAPPKPTHGKRPDAILRRNIFCSACPPIRLDGDPDEVAKEEEGPAEPRPSSLPLKLVAVMYSPSAARQQWNMAVIRDDEEKTFGAFAVGTAIHGAKLVSILDTRVYLDNDGAPEFLDLLAPPRSSPARPPPPPAAKPPAKPRNPLAAELERGIKKVGERRYEVQRSTLESVMGNLALLSRSARIVPEVRDGKPHGLRLLAVKPDGPLAKIGLQKGDVLVSIDGKEMTSPEKALAVYGKLKSARQVALGLERAGKKVSQNYTIR
jgi:general secretion pathway protein C